MKKFLRKILINIFSIWVVAAVFPGLTYQSNIKTLLIAALVFTVINTWVKPVIKLLLLPVNLITMGTLSWLNSVLCLLLLTIIIPQIEIQSFKFLGLTASGFVVPAFTFTVLYSLICASLLLWLITSFISSVFGR